MAGAATLDAALEYRERGLALLPLQPGQKRPHVDVLKEVHGTPKWGGLRRRPASKPEIHAWFDADPATGLGILTGDASGGLVVADLDGEPAGIRHPATPTVKTGRGRHLYLRSASPVRCRPMSFGDLKGEGGYVVAPPSRHPSGTAYAWEVGLDAELADLESVELPAVSPSTPPDTPNLGGTPDLGRCPDESSGTGDRLAAFVPAVEAALPVLGINAPLGSPFRSVLPGPADHNPSASLFRMRDGIWRYSDWRCPGGRKWFTLAEVRAAQVAGRILPPLDSPSMAMWYRRLFHEAGVRSLAHVEVPSLPPGASENAYRVRRGFELLLGIREASEPGAGTPFTRRFAAVWCGLSERRARAGIAELERHRVIAKVGETRVPGQPRPVHLYRPGAGQRVASHRVVAGSAGR